MRSPRRAATTTGRRSFRNERRCVEFAPGGPVANFSLSLSVNPLKRATNDVPISAADLALPRAPPNRGKEERGGRGVRCSVRSSSRSTRNEALSRLVRRIRMHCEPK